MFQVIIFNNQNQLKTYKIQLQFTLALSKSKLVDSTYTLVILKIHRTFFIYNYLRSMLILLNYGLKHLKRR